MSETALLKEVKSLTTATADVNKSMGDVVKRLDAHEKALAKIPAFNAAGSLAAQPIDHKEEMKCGFKSFGHFLRDVREAGISKRPTEMLTKSDMDLKTKAIIGNNEGIGSDGGYFVPPTFSMTLFERLYQDSKLLSRTDNYTVTGNSMVFPRSAESSRANGSRYGGVATYWVEEGAQGTISKPTFGQLTLKLNKMMCLGGLTSELIEDSGMAMETYMMRAFSGDIDFTISDAIVRGTGAGMPLGFINSGCKIAVAKEPGQLARTIVIENIVAMYARLWAGNRDKAVWFINQDALPQLFLMTLGIGTAGVTVFMPPGGISGKPFATLLGLPIIEIEQAETLGTEGDISLVDLSHYVTITKGTAMKSETSIHFYFDTDQQAFRVTYRIDGKPWWATPITPFKGTATQSCFVTLATRA